MRMIKQFERYLFARFQGRLQDLERDQGRSIVLQSQLLAEQHRKQTKISELAEVEFSAYSQWGEDGIIDWLIHRLPAIPRTFVEFGVQDYHESNTRLLLQLRNWRGLVLDGSEKFIKDIRCQDISWRYNLTASHAFIDRDNINELLAGGAMKGPIGLLSVDIDGNDYWVWQAIDSISPAIVVCEYNAVFGDRYPISVPYRADFQRTKAHPSNLYFGASLPALIELGQHKGYRFVGSNSNGCNAFFVRNDLQFRPEDAMAEVQGYPSLFRESLSEGGELTYLNGAARLNGIKHLPVFNVQTQTQCRLEELGELYSPAWSQ